MSKQSNEMYAPASPFSRPIPAGSHALSGMYRQVGLETSVSGSSPHNLVRMLLDGFFDALAQAKGALKDGDIAKKGSALNRAVRIVEEGLKASLDLSNGGELAGNLHAVYGYVALRLTHANLKNDLQAIDECVNLMTPIREAWLAIRSDVANQQATSKEVMA